MSNQTYAVLASRALHDRRLSAHHIHILAVIALHADKFGWSFPSNKLLGEYLDVGVRRVQILLSELLEYGHLEKRSRHRKNGSQTVRAMRIIGVGLAGAGHIELPEDRRSA